MLMHVHSSRQWKISSASSEGDQQMAAGHLISIVDDDASMREALVGLVRSLGYDVRDFASAEGFLASKDLGKFACAITDFKMTGLNGFELKGQVTARDDLLQVQITTARAFHRLK